MASVSDAIDGYLPRKKLSPGHDIAAWCMPCIYGQHIDCYDKAYVGRFVSNRDGEIKCLCKKDGHVEPPEIAGTCRISVSSDYDTHPCGRKVKEEIEVYRTWGGGMRRVGDGRSYMKQMVCGIHAGAYKRVKANEERRSEEARVRREAHDRGKENERIAQDAVDALKQIEVDSRVVGSGSTCHGEVAVQAETILALLREVVEYREMKELGL